MEPSPRVKIQAPLTRQASLMPPNSWANASTAPEPYDESSGPRRRIRNMILHLSIRRASGYFPTRRCEQRMRGRSVAWDSQTTQAMMAADVT
jgi:hypothetical protein